MKEMVEPIAWLRASGAQADVIDGLARLAKDWPTLWNECPRGDWLLGIAVKLGAPHTEAVLAAIGCARVSADLVAPVPIIAQLFAQVLEAAERFAGGASNTDEIRQVTKQLEHAMRGAPDPVSDAAARAALAVGLGVVEREALAAAPAAAAEAQMMSSIDCGYEMAMRWAHDKCALAVRAAIPWSSIETCLSHLGCPR
jgi:hypothetical protein